MPIFRGELLALDERSDGFDLTLTLTREPPRRAKDFGRRIDPAMISHAFVSDAPIATGMAPERIRTERYGV